MLIAYYKRLRFPKAPGSNKKTKQQQQKNTSFFLLFLRGKLKEIYLGIAKNLFFNFLNIIIIYKIMGKMSNITLYKTSK